MQYVLVSACLLGRPVRYDGSHKHAAHEVLATWLREGRVVAVCPETAAGLPVPRPPAEVVGHGGGAAVLAGRARVMDAQGGDVSAAFVDGAAQALRQARQHAIRLAVLKQDSPSCGRATIYDGAFSGNRIPGQGVTAALLEGAGIRVFSEDQFTQADDYLRSLEADAAGTAR